MTRHSLGKTGLKALLEPPLRDAESSGLSVGSPSGQHGARPIAGIAWQRIIGGGSAQGGWVHERSQTAGARRMT